MRERDRIIELVKKGVISSEEALVLLENLDIDTDKQQESSEGNQEEQCQTEEPVASIEDKYQADYEQLEHILDELATRANRASAELDGIQEETVHTLARIKELEEKKMVLDTLEELDSLEEEQQAERQALEEQLNKLRSKLTELQVEKEAAEAELEAIKQEQKVNKKEQWFQGFDMPDDWEESVNDLGQKMTEASTRLGKKVSQASSQLGRFFKETVKNVSDTVSDNVDWKDVNIKVPGMVTNSFSHEFYYPEITASLIDFKVANGQVKFKTWDSQDLKVEANIKIYGKMNADTLFEAFLERSRIEVTEESISFQIPNKRIKADLTVYLPSKDYDYVSVKMLNGDIEVEELHVNDIYAKSTNGDMEFHQLTATMLEIEGVNGDIEITDSQIVDLLAESVNGEIITRSTIENYSVSNVNGDIKLTALDSLVKKVEVKLVNGDIKLSMPSSLGLEGTAKVSIGSIKNRLERTEVLREKKEKTNQLLQFRRFSEDNQETVRIHATTTTGSIYLKDSEQE